MVQCCTLSPHDKKPLDSNLTISWGLSVKRFAFSPRVGFLQVARFPPINKGMQMQIRLTGLTWASHLMLELTPASPLP